MKNRLTALLICLVVLSLLFGCTHAEYEVDTVSSTAAATATTTVAASDTTFASETTTSQTATKKSSTATKKQNDIETTSKTKESSKKDSRNTSNIDLRNLFDAFFDSFLNSRSTDKGIVTSRHSDDKDSDDKVENCTITIQCREILSHREKLKEGYEDFVPDSGYIIKNYSVKYEKGDTVYTVLQRACRENGIKMGAKPTGYGMYVYSINYLPEKACGGTSGWTYYVNGTFPHVSVDNYTLYGGEAIEFRYVV